MFRAWLERFQRSGGGGAVEREIREELQHHLELRALDNVAAGMSPADAREEARRRFGDFDHVLGTARAVRLGDPGHDPLRFSRRSNEPTRGILMSDFVQDLRFGLRMLTKSPGFTAVAVISLALGIGFNATMFTVVDAVLFKPRAVEDVERLVQVNAPRDGIGSTMLSYPDYIDVRDGIESFGGVAAYRTELTTYNANGRAEFVFGESITDNLFEVLGVRTLLGRDFVPDENVTPGAHFVAMVSEPFWRTRLGADPGTVGGQIILGGRSYTLVGIVPAAYTGNTPPMRVQFWVPIAMSDLLAPSANGTSRLERRGARGTRVLARLQNTATLEQAGAEIEALGAALAAEYPASHGDVGMNVVPLKDMRIDPAVDQMLLPAGGVLMGIVGLILLIACANVANMMLARASVRRQEIAVRLALGANRGRLLRQLLTESVMLAAIGGVLAVAVAAATLRLLLAIQPSVMVPISFDIQIEPRMLLFTGLVSLLTGVVFGMVPALQSTRTDLNVALKSDEVQSDGRVRGSRLRGSLVVVQVAVSLVLLISAALLVRSLTNAEAIETGFATESIVGVATGLVFQGYGPAEARDFHRAAMDRLESIPGVEAVALAERLPLESTTILTESVWFEGRQLEPDEDPAEVDSTVVSTGFLELFRIPMVAGRGFGPEDGSGAPDVAIVNPAFADRYWPGESALGKLLSIHGAEGPFFEVVGVNAQHKVRTLGEEPRPHLYLPLAQQLGSGFATLVVRTSAEPGPILEAMRRELQALDRNLAVMESKTIAQHLSLSLFPVRLAAIALSVLGALGATLAAVGVYGVVGFAVARRTREIGIRMAVGADRSKVVKLVVRQGMRSVVLGLAIGLVVSLLATRALASILYGISPTDLLSFGGAALGLLLVAVLAHLMPARRAAHVDPVHALRSE